MENKIRKFEYLLGYDSDWQQYEIICRESDRPVGQASICLLIGEDCIGDSDGFIASYDDTYIKIAEKDYRYVLDLLHDAGKEMLTLAEENGGPLKRSIANGDCIFDDGFFIAIRDIHSNRQKLEVKQFSYTPDSYSPDILDVDIRQRSIDNVYDFDKNDKDSKCLLITQEAFRNALNIANSVIMEINDYLQVLLSDNNGKQV